MSDDTQAAIERLRTALAASTDGEWDWIYQTYNQTYEIEYFGNGKYQGDIGRTGSEADAAFIAAAHNDLPALLEYIEQLEQLIEETCNVTDAMNFNGMAGEALLMLVRARVEAQRQRRVDND